MSSELARSDIWAGTPNEAEYDDVYAAVMATERGRWFLSEYASRNRHADTHAVLGALARLETAFHNSRAAQALGASANGTEQMRSPDVAAVAERIQDIAFTLRERAVGADLCDALDAAVREIVDTCGDGASLHAGDKNQSAGAVAEHENGDAASFAKTGPFMMDALESTKFTEAAATLSAALHSSGDEPADEPAAASRRQSEPSEAVIAALGHEPDLAAGQAKGSDKSPRWNIEPPDFAFHMADPEQLQRPLSATPAENGHAHSLLPQAQLLPGPQDDPADLFESPTEASATAAAIVTPAPAIVAPAAIAPPLMRLMPRAPQPDSLAGLRALSEEEVIALFS